MFTLRIKEIRERRGISGAEFARRVGVTPGAVSQWESGLFIPSTDKLPIIAAVLACDIGELYDEDTMRLANETADKSMADEVCRAAQKVSEQAR